MSGILGSALQFLHNAKNTVDQTLQGVGYQEQQNPGQTAQDVANMTTNFAPNVVKNIGHQAVSMAQAVPRSGAEATMTLQGDNNTYTPNNGVSKALLGDQPISSFTNPNRPSAQFLKNTGAPSGVQKVGAPALAIVGAIASDTPFLGGTEDKAALNELSHIIAKSDNLDQFHTAITKAGPKTQAFITKLLVDKNTPYNSTEDLFTKNKNVQILDKNGEPFANRPDTEQPTEMGPYKYNDQTQTFTPNTNGGAVYSQAQPDLTEFNKPDINQAPPSAQMQPQIPVAQTSGPTFADGTKPIAGERTFQNSGAFPKNDQVENDRRYIQVDGHDIKSTSQRDQINATLNGYGIKGPLSSQLDALTTTKTALANKAKNIVATEGGTIPKDSLVQSTMSNLAETTGQHSIDPQSIPYQAGNYIDQVYARAVGKPITTTVAPDQIPGSIVQDMKSIMNKDAASTWQQEDPTKWSRNQTVSRYARDAVDSALDTKYPKASALNNDMSDLYKAEPSLRRGTNQEAAAAQKAANTPAQPRNLGDKLFGNLGKQVFPFNLGAGLINAATNSTSGLKIAGAVGATALGTAGILKGPDLVKSFDQQSNTNAADNSGGNQNNKLGVHSNSITQLGTNSNPSDGFLHTSDLPKSQGDVRLNGDGTAIVASPSQIKDATGNIIGIDTNSYNKQVKVLNDDINKQQSLIKQNPLNQRVKTMAQAAIDQDTTSLSSLKTVADNSAPLNTNYTRVNSVVGQTSQVLNTLNTTSPNLADLNGQIDNLQQNLDPHYAGLKQQLKGISQAIGGGNLDVKTKDALISVLKEINQQNIYDYYNSINTYIGGFSGASNTVPSGGAAAASTYTPQGAPSYKPQAQDFSNLMSGGQAPTFSNGQAATQQ